ncbi:MAG TPA: lysylphosphatidylglycerol synthase transmembrane domain-containing protein, partial [Thermoleophilaceae bacterium]|nr:lysylphosphatidylglycerol synthase transmembrane domain-containing protein [Thermoleophilaceae bacterium]
MAERRGRPEDERLPDDAALTPEEYEEEDSGIEERAAGLLRDKRRLLMLLLAFVGVVVAIYVLLPKVVGLDDTLERIGDAKWYWIVVALGFNVVAFAAYVAIFRGILSGTDDPKMEARLDFRASYQITMAGLAATRVFSAAGAGGLVLTYWALRGAGMPRRRAACRMVALLVLLYTVYLVALVIFGVLLRTGVLPGDNPVGGTIVPAAIAGSLLVVLGLISLLPEDFERRLSGWTRGYRRRAQLAHRLASGPATLASGARTALGYMRHPSRGALAVVGAVGFWGANIGVLWASFEAFGGNVPIGVLIQGFFVGMAANLIPSP